MKINNLLISVLLAAVLLGCGGNSQSLDASIAPPTAQRMLAGGTSHAVQADAQPTATVSIAGYRSNFKVTKDQATSVVTVTSKIDNSVTTYQNPSLIKFVDKWTSFDIDGAAGQVYRLYQAAFNRTPDLSGLGFWIAANQNGRDVLGIASDFMVSAEFKTLYGDSPANLKLINAFYNNVLHRDGEKTGVEWWVGQMNNGASAEGVLYGFSDSAENKNNLQSAMENGFDYVPFNTGGPIIPKRTSYENAKLNNAGTVVLPPGYTGISTFSLADFFQDGTFALFTASNTYDPKKRISQATPSEMAFWRKAADDSWIKDKSMIIEAQTGCINPRKAVVADFNNDGKPDVLVACHGYDAEPFPGEPMVMLMSTPEGKYHYVQMFDFSGFNHGAAAADLNHDGLVDIVVADVNSASKVRVLMNNGNGTFTEKFNVLPADIKNHRYYTVEIADANNDGQLDIMIGGAEWQSDTKPLVIFGKSTDDFSSSNVVTLPTVPNQGSVLDFVVTSKGLVVNRTSGGGSTFYTSKVVQLVNLDTLASSIIYSEEDVDWTPWLIPTATGITSEDSQRPLTVTL